MATSKKKPAAKARGKRAADSKKAAGMKQKPRTKTAKTGKASKAAKKSTKAASAKPVARKTTAKAALKKTAKAVGKMAMKAAPKKTTQRAASPVTRKGTPSTGKTAFKWNEFFVPLDDRVLILQEGASQMTAGGLYIPDTVEDRPLRGQVLTVGRGHKTSKGHLRPMDVKSGDTVLFGKFAGTTIEMQGQQLLILREDEILGVMSR